MITTITPWDEIVPMVEQRYHKNNIARYRLNSTPPYLGGLHDSRDGSFCHVVIDMGENVCQHWIDQAKQWCVVPGKAPVRSESAYTPIRRD